MLDAVKSFLKTKTGKIVIAAVALVIVCLVFFNG